MSLIWFHRLLIAAAIVFCLGFAGLQFAAFLADGSLGALGLSLVFAAAGAGFAFYLWHLRRYLNLPDAGPDGR